MLEDYIKLQYLQKTSGYISQWIISLYMMEQIILVLIKVKKISIIINMVFMMSRSTFRIM